MHQKQPKIKLKIYLPSQNTVYVQSKYRQNTEKNTENTAQSFFLQSKLKCPLHSLVCKSRPIKGPLFGNFPAKSSIQSKLKMPKRRLKVRKIEYRSLMCIAK